MTTARHYTQPVERGTPDYPDGQHYSWANRSQSFAPTYAQELTQTYSRTTDGTVVREGAVTSETPLARLWRWPTQFLPAGAESFAMIAPFAFWTVAAWLAWRLVKTFR